MEQAVCGILAVLQFFLLISISLDEAQVTDTLRKVRRQSSDFLIHARLRPKLHPSDKYHIQDFNRKEQERRHHKPDIVRGYGLERLCYIIKRRKKSHQKLHQKLRRHRGIVGNGTHNIRRIVTVIVVHPDMEHFLPDYPPCIPRRNMLRRRP